MRVTLLLRYRDAAQIPWGDAGADVICESTGVYTTIDKVCCVQAEHLFVILQHVQLACSMLAFIVLAIVMHAMHADGSRQIAYALPHDTAPGPGLQSQPKCPAGLGTSEGRCQEGGHLSTISRW